MALNNGWIRIDTVSGSGDAAVSVVVLEKNTGRSVTRTETLVGTNAHGVEATATIKQDPMGPFIVIDHIEDDGGEPVSVIDVDGGLYYIVGDSNVDFIIPGESTNPAITDLNDVQGQDSVWDVGFSIIDGGVTYENVMPELSIAGQEQFSGVTPVIGTTRQYVFKIPFNVNINKETKRPIGIIILDDDDVQATFTIEQNGISDNDNP